MHKFTEEIVVGLIYPRLGIRLGVVFGERVSKV